MHSNLPVIPIFIPLLFAAITVLFRKRIAMQRLLTTLATLLVLAFSIFNIYMVNKHQILILEMGNWASPFGITLTLDGLNSILVTTSSVVFLATLIYSFKTIDKVRELSFFYPGFLLILVGINGAFTTGDIFNLFVFYEILLMSSYLLLLVGINKEQLKSSISYVLMNVFAGSLFVISIGYLYTIVGSLNMAYISQTISSMADRRGLYLVGAVMIFGALLTKVGLYSIIRTYGLFYYESNFIKSYILILGAVSIIAGCIGAIYQKDLKQIVIFNIVISLGVMVCGTATLNTFGVKGALFYAVNDILLKAALFIVVGLIIYVSGVKYLQKCGLINKYPLLGWIYFIIVLSLAGVPPFSGFYGKALIIKGLVTNNNTFIAILVALSGLVVFYSLIRIFLNVFYDNINKSLILKPLPKGVQIPLIAIVAIALIIGVSNNLLDDFFDKGIQMVLNPQHYIDLVLKKGA